MEEENHADARMELRRSLSNTVPLVKTLLSDTRRAFSEHSSVGQSGAEDKAFQIAFWNRVSVRCLFALIEGATSLMRNTAAAPRNAQKIKINNKVRAKLLERKYERTDDRVDNSRLQPNGVADNIKLAFRHYPRVFGSELSLDTNSPAWMILKKELIPARNRMVHAGRPEDFFGIQAMQTMGPAYNWFAKSLFEMLFDCAEKVGLRLPAIDRDLVEACTDSQRLPGAATLDSGFYRKVESDPIAALRFLGLTRDLLFKEMKGAHDMVLGLDPKAIGSHVNQFAIRNFLRTLVNYIEAAADAYGLYLQQAKARGGIALTREEECRLSYMHDVRLKSRQGPLDRLVSTYNIFSAKVGLGNEIEEIDSHRRAIEQVLGFRNRLTHPETSQDLFFDELPAHLLILDAMRWLSSSLAVTEVDPRKFLDDGFNSGTAHS